MSIEAYDNSNCYSRKLPETARKLADRSMWRESVNHHRLEPTSCLKTTLGKFLEASRASVIKRNLSGLVGGGAIAPFGAIRKTPCSLRHFPRVAVALAVAVSATFLQGCNGTTSYLDATGESGRHEAVLGIWLTAVSCVVVAAVCVAIVWGIARRRADGDTRTTRREIKSGLSWIYVGVAATVVVLLITFAGTMVTLNAASHPPRTPRIEMDVVAHQWWWEIRYRDPSHPDEGFVTANEVHLPVGEPVRVRLQSADVIHSFWLPQIAGKTDVIPGQTNEMWVEAKQPGSSRGMCGEYCGLQHAMMVLPVTAESPQQFDAWATARRADGVRPATSDAEAGSVVFTRSCGACHTVTGTNAMGRVGPDLSHFASRPFIGAGVLANTPENLQRWIPDAPAVKEGSRMPAVPLDDGELRAVITYLETLR